MDPHISDHFPLKLKIGEETRGGRKPFRFINCLTQHDDFSTKVKHGWEQYQCSGTMETMWKKLKTIKHWLKQLNNKEFKGVEHHIELLRHQLLDVQAIMRQPGYDQDLFTEEKTIKLQLEKWNKIDESILKQKSRIHCLKLGDANNSYFYASLKSRVRNPKY